MAWRRLPTERRHFCTRWDGAQVGVIEIALSSRRRATRSRPSTLDGRGAVTGKAILAANIPATWTHLWARRAGRRSLCDHCSCRRDQPRRNGEVLTVTGSGTHHAPCWSHLTVHSCSRKFPQPQRVADMRLWPEDRAGRAVVGSVQGQSDGHRIITRDCGRIDDKRDCSACLGVQR